MKRMKHLLLISLLLTTFASNAKSFEEPKDVIEANYLLDLEPIDGGRGGRSAKAENKPSVRIIKENTGSANDQVAAAAQSLDANVLEDEDGALAQGNRKERSDIKDVHSTYHGPAPPSSEGSPVTNTPVAGSEHPTQAPPLNNQDAKVNKAKARTMDSFEASYPKRKQRFRDFEQYDDPDSPNPRPPKLVTQIRPEEPLEGDQSDMQGDSVGNPITNDGKPKVTNGAKQNPFALFTIANTDIRIQFSQLPYREKYQWKDPNAPCHSFDLKVPDELAEKSIITLCIYRPNLEFPDETKLFILNSNEEENKPQQNVMGHVVHSPGSKVYGRITNSLFYGEVSILDKDKNIPIIYVIENINLLNKLMRHNPKTLRHMLMVMHAKDKQKNLKDDSHLVYNAVVTKGASLISFMLYTSNLDVNRNPFLMFSTSHNSYISSGEPTMLVDEQGQVKLETGDNEIQVEGDGSIKIKIPEKEYTFRPNGRTIVKEGMKVRTLQEHEGSVAITAYTSSSTYDCVLPTPAFQADRKGGYVCKVCLAMDDTFKKHYLSQILPKVETDLSQNYLGGIIDRVSWIFRSMDLDGDSEPDNIGLDYEAHPLRWTYPDIGGEDVNEQDIEVLFQSLESYNFADCCLGIGFTMRNFPKDVLGKRTQAKTGPSGVCAGRTGRIANNLIIISANSKKGEYSQISEDQLIYATANQVAGAFGANPDGSGDDLCDQFMDERQMTRHHLMWPDVMRNTTLQEQSLSTCSKTDIMKTLSTCRSSCFDIDKHPFCGNGIVEEGEECDCGSEQKCAAQTCCFSRIGKHPCRKTGLGCTSGASTLFNIGNILYLSIASILVKFTSQLLTA